MLPTDQKSFLFLKSHNDLEYNFINPIHGINYLGWKYQHLYILSDDEIKEGDFIYHFIYHRLDSIIVKWDGLDTPREYGYNKVIASTDPFLKITTDNFFADDPKRPIKLPLPSIPQSFIEEYVSEYNKGNKIEEVMIEYDPEFEEWSDESGVYMIEESIKFNPDNTINIKKVKDSWTRDEVIALHKLNCERLTNSYVSSDIKWIEDNL